VGHFRDDRRRKKSRIVLGGHGYCSLRFQASLSRLGTAVVSDTVYCTTAAAVSKPDPLSEAMNLVTDSCTPSFADNGEQRGGTATPAPRATARRGPWPCPPPPPSDEHVGGGGGAHAPRRGGAHAPRRGGAHAPRRGGAHAPRRGLAADRSPPHASHREPTRRRRRANSPCQRAPSRQPRGRCRRPPHPSPPPVPPPPHGAGPRLRRAAPAHGVAVRRQRRGCPHRRGGDGRPPAHARTGEAVTISTSGAVRSAPRALPSRRRRRRVWVRRGGPPRQRCSWGGLGEWSAAAWAPAAATSAFHRWGGGSVLFFSWAPVDGGRGRTQTAPRSACVGTLASRSSDTGHIQGGYCASQKDWTSVHQLPLQITVSLAQGAVHDAIADVADPVFVRSTIPYVHCTRTCVAWSTNVRRYTYGLKSRDATTCGSVARKAWSHGDRHEMMAFRCTRKTWRQIQNDGAHQWHERRGARYTARAPAMWKVNPAPNRVRRGPQVRMQAGIAWTKR